MPWVKLDDAMHAHPKIAAAWSSCRGSVGLHVMALSYCGAYLTDGHVPATFVESKLPELGDRVAAVEALVEAGLWEAVDDGYRVHDYLELNPSRRAVERRRKERKKAGKMGGEAKAANRHHERDR